MRKNIVTLVMLFLASCQMVMADSSLEDAFKKKMELVGKQFYQVKGQKVIGDATKQKLKAEEQEALQFLYAYMPVADVTDYPTSFFLRNIRTSFEAKKEMPWGQEVPELLFRHFVLPIRINNENLDDSRQLFFKELKERVKGMGMKDAILEVNHWCHEHVTYQPSDARTSAPLATLRSAYGRCGEESTFTVAALRSIGIPARQVYTPRWAHTDDNHAWVEAWADGKWYFLGACEPEAVLNLAWFNAPVSRGMLMHTKAFGDYNGPEDVLLRTSNYTEINLIDNYAPSVRIDFNIVDEKGNPVEGARVDFKLYNYAEFCTVVTKYTASDGKTFLSAGKGDMMIWASKDGRYGFAKASFGKDKAITIRLSRRVEAYTDGSLHQALTESPSMKEVFSRDSFDMIPPPERANVPFVSAEARARNLQRFAYEDSIRHAYLATFYNQKTALQVLLEKGLVEEVPLTRNGINFWVAKGEDVSVSDLPSFTEMCGKKASREATRMVNFLVASSGNHAVILDFLQKHQSQLKRAVALLNSLSAKDLRDISMNILEDNFNAKSDQLSPRVEDEMIIAPFKQFFEKKFGNMKSKVTTDAAKELSSKLVVNQPLSQTFKNDPKCLVDWIKQNIRLNPDKQALHIAQTPVGVWKSRLTDDRSRKIFFVDVARSVGVEARVDGVTKKTQYKQNGEWIDVDFDACQGNGTSVAQPTSASTTSSKGLLKLDYQHNGAVENPKYYSHFTLTRINADGSTSLLEYPEEGINWANTFKNGVELDEGDYALVTGTRLANGGVLSEMQLFHVKHGKTTVVNMNLRTSSTEVTVIGNFDSESKFELLGSPNKEVSILSQTGRGYFITGLIGVGQEPTNHALKDIAKVASVFDKWNRPIVLLFEDEASAQKFRVAEFPGLPKNIIFGIDKGGAIRKQIIDNMKLTNANLLPIFTISDTFNRVVYISQGYTIGLGEQLEAVINKL